jgi:probable rRNA maturation factor
MIDIVIQRNIPETDEPVNTTLLEEVVRATCQRIGIADRDVVISLLLTDDTAIQQLNREYRHIDEPTDVLSFPLLDRPLVKAPVEQLWPAAPSPSVTFVLPPDAPISLGDIVISLPAAQRQAAQAGHSLYRELAYLTAHGVLHLAGYDDHTSAGYQAMVALQEAVLQALGILR